MPSPLARLGAAISIALALPSCGPRETKDLSGTVSVVQRPGPDADETTLEVVVTPPRPDLLVLVGIVGPPPQVYDMSQNPADSPWWCAPIQFAARAPMSGSTELVLNRAAIRDAFQGDVKIVVELATEATLLIYADSSVKGGGEKTTRTLVPEDVGESLRPFGDCGAIAPHGPSLGFVTAEGHGMVVPPGPDSVAQLLCPLH